MRNEETGKEPDRKPAGEEPSAAARKPTGAGEESPTTKPAAGRRRLLRWGIVALVLLAALIVWLATRGDGSSEPASPEAGPSRIVTPAQLREAAATLGQPIYWAGPIPGTELELDELGEYGPRVRYLPAGAAAGEKPAKALTIGSYPLPDPTKSLQGYAGRKGAIVHLAPDGREVVTSEEKPTSVYFVSPGNKVQVEVYDPSPKRAMSLALSGQVRPVR